MARELLGIGISFVAVFMVLGLSGALKKRGISSEVSRKLVHILLSNWIILALFWFDAVWAVLVVPACFVVLNFYSYHKGLFKGIEREEGNTLGTVWYAVSLFLLCLAGWTLDMPWMAACAILAMGYGDGLAALVGTRFGRRYFPAPYAEKTLEGSLTVLLFSGLSVGLVCAFFAPGIAIAAAFSCGVIAMAAELYSPRGLDNLTLPLSVGLVIFLMTRFPATTGAFICLGITLLILILAFAAKSITPSGLHIAALMGVLLYVFGGWLSYSALVAFFIFGSLISRFGKSKKAGPSSLHQRRGARGPAQVIANAAPALALALAYRISGWEVFLLAVLASLGAASADTFSSEIGMLSKSQPVSILTFRKMEKGLSGGVTLLGLCGGALGALLISPLALLSFGWTGFLLVFLCGILGSILDSVMGAAFQAKYSLPDGKMTERPALQGAPLPLAKGISWINNDMVNFLSPLLCGAVCVLAFYS